MELHQAGSAFVHGTIEAGGFVLAHAEAGPADPSTTVVSPGSAVLEISAVQDLQAPLEADVRLVAGGTHDSQNNDPRDFAAQVEAFVQGLGSPELEAQHVSR